MTDVDMQECTLSNVDDMMQSAMVQRQIEGASYMTVLPKIMNNSVIEFEINNPECFLELSKTEVEEKYLKNDKRYVKLKNYSHKMIILPFIFFL